MALLPRLPGETEQQWFQRMLAANQGLLNSRPPAAVPLPASQIFSGQQALSPQPARSRPQSAPPSPKGPDTNNPFQFWWAPQDQNEPNIMYGFRHGMGAPFRLTDRALKDVGRGIAHAFDTPARAQERARAAQTATPQTGGAFPLSFNDPAYASAEMEAAQQFGGPYARTLAGLLARIRTQGERSNANQVSSKGATTPYQITPPTRQGIMKQYGFDPWSSPANAAKGAALVLLEQAGAFRKGGGGVNLNDPAVQARAVGGYFGGAAGANNPFGALSDGGTTVGNYTQRVLGPNTGLSAPFLNPYDPRYDSAALGAIGAERKALMTPFSANLNIGPPPEMPKPEELPQTDFTKIDQALEAMRPIEMSERERLRRERTGFWGGMAQAMMSVSGNEGIGTFLLKLGGGALAGRMQARTDIEKEQDRYEEKLAQYNAAVYSNEWAKAKAHQGELMAQVNQNNEYNQANWKVGYSRWLGSGSIDISGTNAVVQQRDDKGNISVRTIPIGSAVDAAIAQQTAQLFSSMGGRQMAGNQQVTGIENGIMGRAAIQSMMGGASSEADGAAAAAPAFYGTFIASHGLTADLLGADGAKSLESTVQKQLMGMGLAPGSQEYMERHDRIVATELAKLGLASPEMMQKMMQVGSTATSFEQANRYYGRSERVSTDSKGRQTSSTTYNAADIFE